MPEHNPEDESFEETLRSIAEELGRHLESSIDSFDSERLAESFGVDPSMARDWVENTSSWLRARAESIGAEVARRVGDPTPTPPQPRKPASDADLFDSAVPHPLDLPTEEQALALAALDSGRWTVEPGSDSLMAKGDGPGPSDALGIVRELRVRDWIGPDGELTLVGHQALSRWLSAANRR
jgi:hypothetical protein